MIYGYKQKCRLLRTLCLNWRAFCNGGTLALFSQDPTALLVTILRRTLVSTSIFTEYNFAFIGLLAGRGLPRSTNPLGKPGVVSICFPMASQTRSRCATWKIYFVRSTRKPEEKKRKKKGNGRWRAYMSTDPAQLPHLHFSFICDQITRSIRSFIGIFLFVSICFVDSFIPQ